MGTNYIKRHTIRKQSSYETTQVTIAKDCTLHFLDAQAYFQTEKSAAVEASHVCTQTHSTAC